MKKRLVMTLLALTIVFVLLPTAAFAADYTYKSWDQGDSRWGAMSISSTGSGNSMASVGCYVTAVAKLLIHAGQQDQSTFTPKECLIGMLRHNMLNAAGEMNYGNFNNGFLQEFGPQLEKVGTDPCYMDKATAIQEIANHIRNGYYIIVRVDSQNGRSTHYMTVDHVSDDIYVMDNNGIIALYQDGSDYGYSAIQDLVRFKYSGPYSYPAIDHTTQVSPLEDFNIESGVLTKYVGLGGNVIIPNGVTSIGPCAFYGCTNLINVTIPKGVTSIDEMAFYACNNLVGVIIPDGVTSIGDSAFGNCYNLSDVTVPQSVVNIAPRVFRDCRNLKTAGPIGGNYNYKFGWTEAIPGGAFALCSGLTSVSIPSSVVCIGHETFYGCKALTSVAIPDGVTTIETWAFADCENLSDLEIPNSVTNIGMNAFHGTPWLESLGEFATVNSILIEYQGWDNKVFIPYGIMHIGDGAFNDKTKLTSVNIPESVISIGVEAFDNCTNLATITIPSTVTRIGNSAFSDCSSLTSITIPGSITNIERYTFYNCTGLTSVNIQEGVSRIEMDSFNECVSLTNVIIPNSVADIWPYAFTDCDNLTIYGYANSAAELYCVAKNIHFISMGPYLGRPQQGHLMGHEGKSIDWVCTKSNLMLAIGDLASEEKILIGCYDSQGQFTGVKVLDAQHASGTIDPNTPSVKLYWLDGAQKPQSPSVTVWGK